MKSKYTMTEVYALADKAFDGEGDKIIASVINHTWGPVMSGDDIVPDLVLENFIKKTLMGIGTYSFYQLIECPFDDLPILMNTMGPKGDAIISWRLDCGK